VATLCGDLLIWPIPPLSDRTFPCGIVSEEMRKTTFTSPKKGSM
jgi:hypothetical protein